MTRLSPGPASIRSAARPATLARAALVALSLGVAALTGACGSPARVDVCHADCNAKLRCNLLNDVQSQNCHNDCNSNSGKYSDEDNQLAKSCTNVGDIRKRQIACYDTTCDLNGVVAATGCIISAQTNYCLKP